VPLRGNGLLFVDNARGPLRIATIVDQQIMDHELLDGYTMS
jgi:hypothetical protein